MRKARIPEIVRDLDAISKKLFEHLKSLEKQKMNALQKIKDAKGVLEGTITKLDENHKTKINQFIQLCSEINPYEISQDKFWDVYTTLSGLVTYLKQIEKDSRWEQL